MNENEWDKMRDGVVVEWRAADRRVGGSIPGQLYVRNIL
jgi:hypothetical protein